MTWAGWKWPTLAVIAAAGVGVLAISALGWQNSDAAGDGRVEAQQAEAIGVVRLRATRACEAPWWEDDYCLRRVQATRFTADDGENGIWLVREHLPGDKPFQDTCWLVEPKRLSWLVDGWARAGLVPASCECPVPSMGRPPRAARDGSELDPVPARIFPVPCRT